MRRAELDIVFDQVLADRRLLRHPYYRRSEAGTLEQQDLAAYAGQYRHFEAALPDVLDAVADGLHDGQAKALVAANLADERNPEQPHLALFDELAASVGARPNEEPAPATAALVDGYRRVARSDPVAALATIAAYEVQASEIATSKARGLRDHYGLDEASSRFWELHGTLESTHAAWTIDALGAVTQDVDVIRGRARSGANLWWSFLDERDAAASRPAA